MTLSNRAIYVQQWAKKDKPGVNYTSFGQPRVFTKTLSKIYYIYKKKKKKIPKTKSGNIYNSCQANIDFHHSFSSLYVQNLTEKQAKYKKKKKKLVIMENKSLTCPTTENQTHQHSVNDQPTQGGCCSYSNFNLVTILK